MRRYFSDLIAAKRNDPAVRGPFWYLHVIFAYPGFRALRFHVFARFFYLIRLRLIARIINNISRFFTGIDIHPGAKIARGVFIDHGTGVVIGETAVVGKNVVIYQGVTLGGTGKDKGKRHPTIMDNVMISAGAKVLGNITVGENSKIGAQAVVLKDVPANCTVVGVPARIVKGDPKEMDLYNKNKDLDPIMDEINGLKKQIKDLENIVVKLKKETANKDTEK